MGQAQSVVAEKPLRGLLCELCSGEHQNLRIQSRRCDVIIATGCSPIDPLHRAIMEDKELVL